MEAAEETEEQPGGQGKTKGTEKRVCREGGSGEWLQMLLRDHRTRT